MEPTTKDKIRRWLKSSQAAKQQRMLVLYDHRYDYDFPIFVEDPNRIPELIGTFQGGNPGRYVMMECYDLSKDIEEQLAEHRALHV